MGSYFKLPFSKSTAGNHSIAIISNGNGDRINDGTSLKHFRSDSVASANEGGATTLEEEEMDLLPSRSSQGLGTSSWRAHPKNTMVIPHSILMALAIFLALLCALVVALWSRSPPHTGPYDLNCVPCNSNDTLCDKWGSQVILRSRSYQGSSHQMQPFIDKIRAGQPVSIGVIGGSISACVDSKLEDCYVNRFHRELEPLLQEYGSSVTIQNGAVNAVGSDFFSACWPSLFIQKVDLMIIELAVNDVWSGKENQNMEDLIRSLHSHKMSPSMVFLEMYSPLHPWTNGGPGIENLAQFYDLPVVSHRNVIYHQRHLHQDSKSVWKWFSPGGSPEHPYWPGGHHPSKLGHELTSDILLSWFKEQFCRTSWTRSLESKKGRMGLDLPASFSPWSPYGDVNEPLPTKQHPEWSCFGPQAGPLHFPIIEKESHGFKPGHWKAKEFLVGFTPGDRIAFDVEVRHGRVGVLFWRSRTIGLGAARAWLDDEYDRGEILDGHWDDNSNIPVRGDVRTDRPAGRRKLYIEVIEATNDPDKKHEFRITSIIT